MEEEGKPKIVDCHTLIMMQQPQKMSSAYMRVTCLYQCDFLMKVQKWPLRSSIRLTKKLKFFSFLIVPAFTQYNKYDTMICGLQKIFDTLNQCVEYCGIEDKHNNQPSTFYFLYEVFLQVTDWLSVFDFLIVYD